MKTLIGFYKLDKVKSGVLKVIADKTVPGVNDKTYMGKKDI